MSSSSAEAVRAEAHIALDSFSTTSVLSLIPAAMPRGKYLPTSFFITLDGDLIFAADLAAATAALTALLAAAATNGVPAWIPDATPAAIFFPADTKPAFPEFAPVLAVVDKVFPAFCTVLSEKTNLKYMTLRSCFLPISTVRMRSLRQMHHFLKFLFQSFCRGYCLFPFGSISTVCLFCGSSII